MRQRFAFGTLVVVLFVASPAFGQPRAYVFGSAGHGSIGDEEGSLGHGGVFGAGGGWNVTERLSIEGALTKSRHERIGSLSWEGEPLAITVRALYWFGQQGATTRVFIGGGGGYFRYPGTFTETIHDSPTAPPRTESRDWRVSGRAIELGGGVDIDVGSRVFVRPEAWVTFAGVERVRPAPEPPYALARIAVSAGLRF